MGTRKFFGFDITPRKEYRERIERLVCDNECLWAKLRHAEEEMEDLKEREEEMDALLRNQAYLFRELEKRYKALLAKVPQRDSNGRFTSKH
jgi:predicted transcriptional regulator